MKFKGFPKVGSGTAPDDLGAPHAKFKWTVVIVAAVIVVVVIGGFILTFLSFQSGSNSAVTLEISKPTHVTVGVPFTIGATVSNQSDSVLQDVRLVLSAPEGISFLG